MLKHDYALQKIKEVFTSDPVLCFYDPGNKVTIQANASSTRLGPWTSGICPKGLDHDGTALVPNQDKAINCNVFH